MSGVKVCKAAMCLNEPVVNLKIQGQFHYPERIEMPVTPSDKKVRASDQDSENSFWRNADSRQVRRKVRLAR